MKLATSYFSQIRNFKEWMIPVSTALSDPDWYKPKDGKEYFYDKRGIVCGLRYEPLIVQRESTHICPCNQKEILQGFCPTMIEYRELLEQLDFNRIEKAFQHCADKFWPELPFGDHQPEAIIVLIVYEAPNNLCSERAALQDYFTKHGYPCRELRYPIC